MTLRPGVRPYFPPRPEPWRPTLVRWGGAVGVVTRVTPSGNHLPGQAFVQFYGDNDLVIDERWIPLRELRRATA